MDKYFINCDSEENLTSFANALLDQKNLYPEVSKDETARDIIMEHCGDTSVEQVWQNEKWVMFLSTEGGHQVMNLVEKKDERTMQSVEVS